MHHKTGEMISMWWTIPAAMRRDVEKDEERQGGAAGWMNGKGERRGRTARENSEGERREEWRRMRSEREFL